MTVNLNVGPLMRFNFINELINAVGTRSPEDARRHAVAVLSSLTVVSGEHQNHNGKESETSGGLQGSLLLLSFVWWITSVLDVQIMIIIIIVL